MRFTGQLTRLGGIPGGAVGGLYTEGCDTDASLDVASTFDEFWRYQAGSIFLSDLNLPNKLSACGLNGFASSDAQHRRSVALVTLHEMLHWLGFTHQYHNDNRSDDGYPNPLWPVFRCDNFSPLSSVAVPTLLKEALTFLDTKNDPNNLAIAIGGLACTKPLYDPNLEANATENPGATAKYTNNTLYGIQTGSQHKSCGWGPAGQICTMPTRKTIHWCFAPWVSDNQFKSDFRNFSGIDGTPLPAGTGSVFANSAVDFGGFAFEYHSSCDDAAVTLVVDTNPCNGNGSSNIDGYVCASTSQPVNSANELDIVNHTPWETPGSYYAYDLNGGWMTLSIDTSDIANTSFSAPNPVAPGFLDAKTEVFRHAIITGLLWAIGIGSRTDMTTSFSSRALVPYAKRHMVSYQNSNYYTVYNSQVSPGTRSWMNGGELCKAKSFGMGSPGKFEMISNCGTD